MAITKLIEQLLMKYPKCRDSDKELIIGILQMRGANLTDHQREVIRGISFESIRRTRQKLQEDGLYLPSPEVGKQRRLKSMIIQQNAPTASNAYMETLIANQPVPIKPPHPHAIPWIHYEPYSVTIKA